MSVAASQPDWTNWPARVFSLSPDRAAGSADYPRLQRIKAQWDPRNVFRHALSIRAGD